MAWLLSGLILFVTILLSISTICAYFYIKYLYSFWHRRHVKYLPATFPFGNYGKNFLQLLSVGEVCEEIYKSTNEPFIGVFGAFRPMLVICDPALIRNILVKDFQHFVDRGIYYDENDPLSAHLFTMSGDKWKNLRSKLTPAFSPGRLKAMFSTLVECGRSLNIVIKEAATSRKEIAVREYIACYSINIIASVIFGLDVDCVLEPNHPFRENGRKFFANNWKNGLRNFCRFVCPKLMHVFGMRFIDSDVEAFFFDLVKRMIELRENRKIVRKDIFQMLIQLRNSGKVQLDDEWATDIVCDEKNKMMTLNEMVAQSFVFFVAGFETSSTTMSYCLFELARNPVIQQQVQDEIDSVLIHSDGHLTFEAINEMKYLDACIDETLRKYPPSPFINRQCTKDYIIPETNITIEKGIVVQIPVYGIQHDEKFYPDPKKFDPDRFLDANRKNKTFVEMPYMPFGEGPRNCIGLRMGKVETKIGIVLMLQNFSYSLGNQHSGGELDISPTSFVMAPKTSIMLKVQSRDRQSPQANLIQSSNL